MGCVGAWTLHPSQVAVAKRVFSPDPAEVAFAQKIIAAMPDGSGAVLIDGKMQDDATWKQAKVLVDLARLVAAKTRKWPLAMGYETAKIRDMERDRAAIEPAFFQSPAARHNCVVSLSP